MRGAHAEGRLDGEGRNTGGAKEAVRGEDHQVGGHPGSGRWVEAGDGENGGHGPEGWKMPEIRRLEKKLTFLAGQGLKGGVEQYGAKSTTLGVLFRIRKMVLLYHRKARFRNSF